MYKAWWLAASPRGTNLSPPPSDRTFSAFPILYCTRACKRWLVASPTLSMFASTPHLECALFFHHCPLSLYSLYSSYNVYCTVALSLRLCRCDSTALRILYFSRAALLYSIFFFVLQIKPLSCPARYPSRALRLSRRSQQAWCTCVPFFSILKKTFLFLSNFRNCLVGISRRRQQSFKEHILNMYHSSLI